jgi:glycine oxidase
MRDKSLYNSILAWQLSAKRCPLPRNTVSPTLQSGVARPQDVIVVGAGVIGCAIAYELSRRGISVQLLDERAAGLGATHASAGILAPFIEAGHAGPLFELTRRSLDLFDDFTTRLADDSGIPVLYRRTGTLQVALDDQSMLQLRNTAARLEAQGVVLGLVDAKTLRAEEPHVTDAAVGGLVIPAHGFIAAGELTRALAAAARRRGAQVTEGLRVRRIAAADRDVVVETDRGSLSAAAVVLAAGSWSPHIEIAGASAAPPIHPVRGQLVRVAWRGPTLRRVAWGDRCYLVPWDDGTLLIGATVEDAGFDERTTVAGVRDLLDAATEMIPHVWTCGFTDARAGLRPGTPDEMPILGRSSAIANLVYATGHYRNGILLAPLTARLVADLLVDDRVDPILASVTPQRFGAL